MKLLAALSAAALIAVAATPASAAKMMACTGENMAKAVTGSSTQPYTMKRAMMDREVAKANMAMSKGDMRSACKSFGAAQRAMM